MFNRDCSDILIAGLDSDVKSASRTRPRRWRHPCINQLPHRLGIYLNISSCRSVCSATTSLTVRLPLWPGGRFILMSSGS